MFDDKPRAIATAPVFPSIWSQKITLKSIHNFHKNLTKSKIIYGQKRNNNNSKT